MQAFWDVLWPDAKAFVAFGGGMLLVSLPVSALGGMFGAVRSGVGTWRALGRTVCRGACIGTLVALGLSMLLEFGFRAEGLASGRRALRDLAYAQLFLVAPCVALVAGFLAARRYAPATLAPRRRFALWQLFACQLIVGLLLGWWVFTRRDQIRSRSRELNLQARQQALDDHYGPFGWRVVTWHNHEKIVLHEANGARQQPLDDRALAQFAPWPDVISIAVRSEQISDRGLAELCRATEIRDLNVVSNQISDQGLAVLAEHPQLRSVGIYSANVTAAGLKTLGKSKTIGSVYAQNSSFTVADLRDLTESYPDVQWNLFRGNKRLEY